MTEWIAYDQVYHLTDPYWIGAMVASTIANCNRGRNTKPYKVQDFMPQKGKKVKQQSTEQIKTHLDSLLGITF